MAPHRHRLLCIPLSLVFLCLCVLLASMWLTTAGGAAWLLRPRTHIELQLDLAAPVAHDQATAPNEEKSDGHYIPDDRSHLQGRKRMMITSKGIRAEDLGDCSSCRPMKKSNKMVATNIGKMIGMRRMKKQYMLLEQPGSKPPMCHNECARCQGGVCVPRPSFSRGGSAQHAVWTCSCLH